MTNEELERIMNFIIERQERTVEQQAEHDERIARFERSYTAIANLLQQHDEQLVEVTTNLNGANRAVEVLAANAVRHDAQLEVLAANAVRHDAQLEALTVSISDLTVTVNRYITARGNGSNGSGQA